MEKWTENRMAVSAADLNVLLNAEGNLDFNLVRPNPAGLDITEGGLKRRATIKAAEARRCSDVEALARAKTTLPILTKITRGAPRDTAA